MPKNQPRHPPYLPYRSDLKERARALRKSLTAPERKLWYEFLSALPARFTRQKPLADYIVDFYCSQARLVIEVDGDSHYQPGASGYDERRTEVLGRLGIRVLRFTNREVIEQFPGVCEKILQALREPPVR
jgi:very-short-patch-repair endonuclease